MQGKKLYRSRKNRVLTGLAGGLGQYFNIDPTVIRVLFVIFEFATAGLLIIGYLLVSLFVPSEPVSGASEPKKT
jgi:phage shock protein C